MMGNGTTRNMYEVEQFSDINKLCNVASYWIYIGIQNKLFNITKTAGPILDIRSQISVVTRKQTPSLQSNSKASLDLWNPAVGNCIELKSRDTRAIPVKSATHNNRHSMVYA
jgi:hypothetical protein